MPGEGGNQGQNGMPGEGGFQGDGSGGGQMASQDAGQGGQQTEAVDGNTSGDIIPIYSKAPVFDDIIGQGESITIQLSVSAETEVEHFNCNLLSPKPLEIGYFQGFTHGKSYWNSNVYCCTQKL